MTQHTVTVTTVGARPCAVVRAATSWPDFRAGWPGMLDEVWSYLRSLPDAAPGHNVMIYRDPDPSVVPETVAGADPIEVVVEVGAEVGRPVERQGRVIASELPSGRAARTVHTGGPGTIGEAYDALIAWCDARHEARTAIKWEVYGHPDADGDYPIDVYWLLHDEQQRAEK